DDYELLEEVARGGMGVVYKARQKSLNRIVALKAILAGRFATPREVQRFLTEVEAAARLDHPGIVPVFEVGQRGAGWFYSMAFVDGQSLAQRIAAGPLPPQRAADLVRQAAEAISYAHAQGVIHRDLKPANILLDSADRRCDAAGVGVDVGVGAEVVVEVAVGAAAIVRRHIRAGRAVVARYIHVPGMGSGGRDQSGGQQCQAGEKLLHG